VHHAVKGVSPIIAAVLLIAFTLTIALLVGPFFTQTVETAQEGNNEQQSQLLDAVEIDLEIVNVKYNKETGNYTVSFANRGSSSVSNFTATLYGEQPAQKTIHTELKPGEIHTFQSHSANQSNDDRLEIAVNELDVQTETSLEDVETGVPPSSPETVDVIE